MNQVIVLNPITIYEETLTKIKIIEFNYQLEQEDDNINAFEDDKYLFWIKKEQFQLGQHIYSLNFYALDPQKELPCNNTMDKILYLEKYMSNTQITSFVSKDTPKFICFQHQIVVSVTNSTKPMRRIFIYQYMIESKQFYFSQLKFNCEGYDLYHDSSSSNQFYIILSKASMLKCLELHFSETQIITLKRIYECSLHTLNVKKLIDSSYGRKIFKFNENLLIILQTHKLSQSVTLITWGKLFQFHTFHEKVEEQFELLHLQRKTQSIFIVMKTLQFVYQIYSQDQLQNPQVILQKALEDLQQIPLSIKQVENISLDLIEQMFLTKLMIKIPSIESLLRNWDHKHLESLKNLLLLNIQNIDQFGCFIIYSIIFSLKNHPPFVVIILQYLKLVAYFSDEDEILQSLFTKILASIPYIPQNKTFYLAEMDRYQNINEQVMECIQTNQLISDSEKIKLLFDKQIQK